MTRSRGGAARGDATTSRQTRGKREEGRRSASRQEATGRQEAEVARRETEAARQEDERRRRLRDNQPANERQTGGEASANKRQRRLKSRLCVHRTRGRGGGATRGVATTSRGTRGKREGRHQQTRGDDVTKAGGASRRREAEVALQEDTRRKQRVMKTRGRGGGGATRCDVKTSQGKLKVGGRRTIPPPPSKKLWR